MGKEKKPSEIKKDKPKKKRNKPLQVNLSFDEMLKLSVTHKPHEKKD